MAEDTQATPEESQNPPAEAKKTDMIPKARFDEVNENYKALKKQIDAMTKAQSEQETAKLAEVGEYKKLYEDLLAKYTPLEQEYQRAIRSKSALEISNQSRLERIPEESRWAIPKYDDPVEMSAWLDVAMEKLAQPTKPQAPSLNGGAGGGAGARESASTLSADAQGVLDIARGLGYEVNPERAAAFARNPIKPSKTGE